MKTYIAYFDETGDDGVTINSSDHFILTSLYMPAESWQQNFEKMRILRRELKDKYGFHVSEEMHTKHFLTDKNPYREYHWSKETKQDIIKAHKVYAEEIIKMYHGEEFIKQAEERYGKVAKGGIPENIKEVNLSSESTEFKLCDILVKVGFASSKSEARRMIQGNGVKVNSEVVNDINATIEIKGDVVIQFGKNKFIKVV